jgi:hypothetical protein
MPVDVPSQHGTTFAGRPAPDSGAQWSTVFTTLNDSFWSLCRGPAPLALPGALFASDRARPVRLVEAQRLLLARRGRMDPDAKDRVLAELVRRAQTGAPEWIVGASGVLLPGLAAKVNRLARGYAGDRDDLEAEVLAGFLTALHTIDPDSGRLAARLCWAGYRAGLALRHRDADDVRRRAAGAEGTAPHQPWGHPDFVLAAAVRAGVITADEADLIGATRLDGVRLEQAAAARGSSRTAVLKRRYRAERRLVAVLRNGDLTTPLVPGVLSSKHRGSSGNGSDGKQAEESPARGVLPGPQNTVAKCRIPLPRPAQPTNGRPERVPAGAA